MDNNEKTQKIIDLRKVIEILWSKKKTFYKVWAIVFVLSCVWVFPKPRYYTCEVKLAPETGGTEVGGGLASIASSFGFNLGGLSNSDAIYPTLYPELFESPEFITSLFDIQIKTLEGDYEGDYYTYLKAHQKKNVLTYPLDKLKSSIKSLFEEPDSVASGVGEKKNSFRLSKKDYDLVLFIQNCIKCSNDKKTDVTTLIVTDQDPLVSALLADSVCTRLQDFVIQYRTKKARVDASYYQALCDSAKVEYDKASAVYCDFVDSHSNLSKKAYSHEADVLDNEREMKKQTYIAFSSQVQAMNAKIQERTPVFTVLKSATVPVKPAGPKRMIFVAGMLILSSLVLAVWLSRKELHFLG